jgi:broad specificity phosphatase PhoE
MLAREREMRIILVRHGQTEENATGIIQGHLPGRLSARGREQVRRLAERLARERIDAAYSSDLARARDTTEAIMRLHPGVPVTWCRDLRERFLGRYQGRSGSDLDRSRLAEAEEVEKDEQILDRARRVLRLVREEHRSGTVLLSGHGGINYAIVAVITGRTIAEAKASVDMSNTGVFVFEGEDGSLAPVMLNDVSHLSEERVS